MPITSLRFSNLGPFDDVSFEFDKQVNVFTGPNNSWKSTALWVLAEILVYPFAFRIICIANPMPNLKSALSSVVKHTRLLASSELSLRKGRRAGKRVLRCWRIVGTRIICRRCAGAQTFALPALQVIRRHLRPKGYE